MPSTSEAKNEETPGARTCRRRWAAWLPVVLFGVIGLTLTTGCTEFSHFGHINDLDGNSIHSVEIHQQGSEGEWRLVGRSDGKGKMNIFKSKFSGGGKVRLRKRGYRTILMSESRFFKSPMIIMPETGDGDYGREIDESDDVWNR
jgi:hypothetical protein